MNHDPTHPPPKQNVTQTIKADLARINDGVLRWASDSHFPGHDLCFGCHGIGGSTGGALIIYKILNELILGCEYF